MSAGAAFVCVSSSSSALVASTATGSSRSVTTGASIFTPAGAVVINVCLCEGYPVVLPLWSGLVFCRPVVDEHVVGSGDCGGVTSYSSSVLVCHVGLEVSVSPRVALQQQHHGEVFVAAPTCDGIPVSIGIFPCFE